MLFPCPRAIALSILAFGKLDRFAFATASASRGLKPGSGPYILDASEISLARMARCLPLAASFLPLSCLIDAHLLWPELRGLEVERSRPWQRRQIRDVAAEMLLVCRANDIFVVIALDLRG